MINNNVICVIIRKGKYVLYEQSGVTDLSYITNSFCVLMWLQWIFIAFYTWHCAKNGNVGNVY